MPKQSLFASAAAAALAFAGSAFAQAQVDTITMPMDEVRVLTFSEPVKTVFVGNPTIADITVIDARHVFLQAKSFGATNLLALDENGKQVVEEHVTVYNHQDSVVTLQRGAGRTTLNCIADRCEVHPTPGDEATPFDAVTGQVEKYQQSQKAAATP
jgi:Flp pilus assembly secretin CpaC